jgi:Ca2+-binding EF-hand superfamily protein
LGALAGLPRETAPSPLQGQTQYLPDDPNRLMLNEKSNIDVNQRQLSKEREDERILNQLRGEFSKIDVSSDGLVTFDEIKGVLGGRTEVAEQIFQEIDMDNSGAVSLQEFVETYFIK